MEPMSQSSEENTETLLERARENERAGRAAEAGEIYLRVVEREPQHGEALLQLGLLALAEDRPRVAVEFLQRAVAASPATAAFHSALGRALQKAGSGEAALAAHGFAVQLAPQDAGMRLRLGEAQWREGRLAAARATLDLALRLDPALTAARRVLVQVAFDSMFVDEAIAELRRHIAAGLDERSAHDMLLFWLHFHPASTPASLHAGHTAWSERHAAPLRKCIQPSLNDRTPGRRLKIGYVSADFRRHAVAYSLLPLLARHDRAGFEIFAYASVARPDRVTGQFTQVVDGWRNVADWSDEKLAGCIRADGIDILVDLSLHSEKHRLLVFARKPAPVQVTWGGYPGSTGLDTIDYRLTDRFLDPLGRSDACYSEKSVRLPDSFWCYDPLEKEPAVSPLPALSAGFVTFGCLNKTAKINPGTIALWARVLHAVPGSRLIMLAGAEEMRARIRAQFGERAINPARLEFVGWQRRHEYFVTHHRIDIALDPSPYGGHITLCDGLWMGVPAIALPGETAASRAGLSLLNNVGLPEWVAASCDDFVRIAVEQTRDIARLAEVRAGLRARLTASPLMDASQFARHLEAAYRAMWRTWCDGAA